MHWRSSASAATQLAFISSTNCVREVAALVLRGLGLTMALCLAANNWCLR